MNLTISIRAEIIKTKRSASFWLSILGAAVIPVLFLLAYFIEPARGYTQTWDKHLLDGWQVFNAFLLPMFIILICSLIPQIEFKNNAWKQVFASPQSIGTIFFSKFLTILIMVVFLLLAFNILLILAAIVPNLFYSKYRFLSHSIDFIQVLRMNVKTFVSLLAIISFQYWLSLRFKNFIVPIGIGLALLVISLLLYEFHWRHIYKVPYAFPVLTMDAIQDPLFKMENHEWNALGYFAFFTTLAFLDMRFRKERG